MRNIILILIIFFSCDDINKYSAGSYPYAEKHLINQTEDDVIKKIKGLKEDFPTYKVPSFMWAGKEITLQDKFLENGYLQDHR